MGTIYPKSWNNILGLESEYLNIYAQKGLIPVGSLRPWFMYYGNIPEEEIVYIKFDSIYKSMEERNPLNILILGGSGDGKSKLMNLMHSILSDAGYWIIKIDPKSFQSGYAKIKNPNNENLPPNLKPKGIKLKHYLPLFVCKDFDKMIHNFNIYSMRLYDINEKEMWMGLGATSNGASKLAKTVQEKGKKVTYEILKSALFELYEKKEINSQSLNSMFSILADLEDTKVITDDNKELNILHDFLEGKSICISYRACGIIFMSFDIGVKIRQCVKIQNSIEEPKPIMFFFDDSSFYAEESKFLKFNLAIQEIKSIGFNYRSLGINNCMAVQSLGVIDKNVAESYKIKIITPSFSYPESLRNINIPAEAIGYIQRGLYHDKENNISQYILITEENRVKLFYPFNPVANHFKNIYFSKKLEEPIII